MNKRDEKKLSKLWHYLHFDCHIDAVDAERIIGMLIQQQYDSNDYDKLVISFVAWSEPTVQAEYERQYTEAKGIWVDDRIQVPVQDNPVCTPEGSTGQVME